LKRLDPNFNFKSKKPKKCRAKARHFLNLLTLKFCPAFSKATTAKIRGRANGAAFREAKRGKSGVGGAKPLRSYFF
jgi:hypothetical protein